jgi:hypothetical protein
MVIVQFIVVAAVIDAVWLKLMNPVYRSHIGCRWQTGPT